MAFAPTSTAIFASSTVIIPFKIKGKLVEEIIFFNSSIVFGPTGCPFNAIVIKPAPSISIPTARAFVFSAFLILSITFLFFLGLIIGTPLP